MYKPHYIEFLTPSQQGGGYDEDGNPVPASYDKLEAVVAVLAAPTVPLI